MDEPIKCSVCQKTFGVKQSLLLHMRKFHPEEDISSLYTKKGAGRKCPDCHSDFTTIARLCSHVEHEHGAAISYNSLEFNTEQEKVRQGVSTERIKEDMKNMVTIYHKDSENEETDDENDAFMVTSRREIISTKDIYNIAKRFGANSGGSVKLHTDDAKSIQLLEATENYIIYHKAQHTVDESGALQNDDFMLVIQSEEQRQMLLKFGHDRILIDSTHGTNGYNFKLTTIMVVDEWDEGFPVAHCLTTRENHAALNVFFKKMFDQVGDVACKTLITDDFPGYKNAWQSVMSPPENILLCQWHVNRAWEKMARKLIADPEKRIKIYMKLKGLNKKYYYSKLQFEKAYSKYLHSIMNDENTQRFAEYLRDSYGHRKQMWATAYRIGCRINVNMRIENFHLQLKKKHMNGRKCQRVDSCVQAIKKNMDSKVADRKIKINRGKSSHRSTALHKYHKRGEEIAQVALIRKTWHVGPHHQVKTNANPRKCDAKCGLQCSLCKACFRAASCTCFIYQVYGDMCKHIHAVVSREDRHSNNVRAKRADTSSKAVAQQSKDTTRNNIRGLASTLMELANRPDLEHENMQAVAKMLQNSVNLLMINPGGGGKLQLTEEASKEPANKKMKLQPRFSSVVKRRKKPHLGNRPTPEEETMYGDSLSDDETDEEAEYNIQYTVEHEHMY